MSKKESYSSSVKSFLAAKTFQELGVNPKGKEKFDSNSINAFLFALSFFLKKSDNGFYLINTVNQDFLESCAYIYMRFSDAETRAIQKKDKFILEIKSDNGEFLTDNIKFSENEKSFAVFLRTMFIMCGTVLNPQRGYHLSFSNKKETVAEYIKKSLGFFGIEPKLKFQNEKYVLYLKDSEKIEDVLSVIGAQKFSLELIDMKIEKSIRNDINRKQNFDDANIKKSVDNAQKIILDIEYLKSIGVLIHLNDNLKSAAKLRISYPEKSLRELCEISSEKLTKSGLNHRFLKISEIAKEYRGKRNE